MTRLRLVSILAAVVFAVSVAHAQTPMRIRGIITSVEGNTLAVKSRDGVDLNVALADNLTVAVAQSARFEDIKVGDYVGTTTTAGSNGDEVAIEVHYLAPTVAPGQATSDLVPEAKMTNANVQTAVVATNGYELTLQIPGGTQKVVVPSTTPIVRTVPGARSDLRAGEYVFVSAQKAPDGAITAQRVQVSRDGVRPPQ